MPTSTNVFENIEVRPTGRGRPVAKQTVRARSATIRALSQQQGEDPTASFTARDIAKRAKVGRKHVALALRWLENKHDGIVAAVGNAPREERGRPERVYMLAAYAPSPNAPSEETQSEETQSEEEGDE